MVLFSSFLVVYVTGELLSVLGCDWLFSYSTCPDCHCTAVGELFPYDKCPYQGKGCLMMKMQKLFFIFVLFFFCCFYCASETQSKEYHLIICFPHFIYTFYVDWLFHLSACFAYLLMLESYLSAAASNTVVPLDQITTKAIPSPTL